MSLVKTLWVTSNNMETQETTKVETVPDRVLERERSVDDRFEKIEAQLANQPTKEEFEKMLEGLATKKDIELFNTYAHRFTLGVEILGKSSKWILYTVITIGGVAAGVIFIKNGFVWVATMFGIAITRVK